jgi:hypothetical protein
MSQKGLSLAEISDIEFFSSLFGKRMSIKDFAKNISDLNDSDFPKKRNIFDYDLRSIMAILIEKGCFSEHDFKTAAKVFFGICNQNKPKDSQVEIAL